MKRIIIVAAVLALAGCASSTPTPEQQAVNQLKTLTTEAQLCQAWRETNEMPQQYGGSIATMPREAFDVYYARRQYLNQQTAARGIECDAIKARAKTPPPPRKPASEITPQQKQTRAFYVCNSSANMTRFANPEVALEMCRRGYTASAAKCERDIAEFNRQVQTLTGEARAEYGELGNAFRAGCSMK